MSGELGKVGAESLSGEREVVITFGRGGFGQIDDIGGGGESGSSLMTCLLSDVVD